MVPLSLTHATRKSRACARKYPSEQNHWPSTVLEACLRLKKEKGDLGAQNPADPAMCMHGSFLPETRFYYFSLFYFSILFSVDFIYTVASSMHQDKFALSDDRAERKHTHLFICSSFLCVHRFKCLPTTRLKYPKQDVLY